MSKFNIRRKLRLCWDVFRDFRGVNNAYIAHNQTWKFCWIIRSAEMESLKNEEILKFAFDVAPIPEAMGTIVHLLMSRSGRGKLTLDELRRYLKDQEEKDN